MRLFFLSTTLATSLLAACHGEPAEVRVYRDSMALAAAVLDRDDPDAADELRELIAEAERVTAEKPGREAVEVAWRRCLAFASEALEPPDPEEELARRWPEVERLAAERLRELAGYLDETSAGRRTSREVTRARMRLALARRHAAAGRLARATLEAEAAMAHLVAVTELRSARISRFSDPRNLALWQEMVAATLAGAGRRAEVIVVDKLDRRLSLFRGDREVAHYPIELGTNGLAPKFREGDAATPEGVYRVVEKKDGAETRFYKALLIDYPNALDRQRFDARKAIGALPDDARIGSLIEIHGDGGVGRDWTDGCVALTNRDMDALYREVSEGTPVVIVGTY
ncbi:MAG: L,D-transpeptidase [Thermoanaerobaculia bacterium]|nr:L,D-transpeptidase [Thermoanaerobaculia bacterium]